MIGLGVPSSLGMSCRFLLRELDVEALEELGRRALVPVLRVTRPARVVGDVGEIASAFAFPLKILDGRLGGVSSSSSSSSPSFSEEVSLDSSFSTDSSITETYD